MTNIRYGWIFAQRIDINIRTQLLKRQKLRLDFDEITSTILSLQTKTLPKAQLNLYGLLCRHVPDKMQNVKQLGSSYSLLVVG